ncbi:MAG: adenosylcobalamin-dependent ribonucleoside-diphosphate reductase [Pseudomonadota bacterium]
MASIAPISQQIWDMKYRLKTAAGDPVDKTLEDSWARVAKALAAAEAPDKQARYETEFYRALSDFKFLPAGRILAGAGTGRDVTLFNCFVMGRVPDSLEGIFENLKEAALTMQQGGGIGYDFSTIRPKGALVKGVGADASGPLSFMDVWDSMCRTIMSAGYRLGAMMATMRCDHPDIEDFIKAKRDPGRLRMFNLSVLITDAFMQAVQDNKPWDLVFDGTVHKTLDARDLWDTIMRSTYAYAEPGVIFIDRINAQNNLHYCEDIFATNPCGEQPLPPYGACLLGSVNLTRFISEPFTQGARLDEAALRTTVRTAVRMMDNVIDVSQFPLAAQRGEAHAKRRIGLGVTGLADALIMLGQRYGGDRSLQTIDGWLGLVQREAYLASVDFAREKGAFALFDRDQYLASPTIQALDEDVQAAIAEHGIRNALLTSIAPTGTISLFADNVSSGLEPVFSFTYTRKVLMPDGSRKEETVADHAYRLFRSLYGDEAELPDYFVTAQTLSPQDHVKVQAVVQRYVDSSISKTINCPEDISFEDFKDVYTQAYALGCKGCTTYRPNDVTGSVLEVKKDDQKKAEPQLPLAETAVSEAKPQDAYEAGGVVYMTQPLDRPEAIPGKTYKVRWPASDHAMYITINDVIQDGRRRPFEVFINSKSMEHYAWTVALTRMISAVFRRGGDVSFVVEELKAVFDPRGGYWVGGRYVPSLLASIGDVIEQHLIDIGFIEAPDGSFVDAARQKARQAVGGDSELPDGDMPVGASGCPKCGAPALIKQEGCETCLSCGYSKCG